MRQTELELGKRDRKAVEGIRSTGELMARGFDREHILSALDRKVPESPTMQVLGVGRTTIWRTCAAYLELGLEYTLNDAQRPGQPKRYHVPEEAEVAALACSTPAARQTVDRDFAQVACATASRHAQDQP
jgi:hypothetical protein